MDLADMLSRLNAGAVLLLQFREAGGQWFFRTLEDGEQHDEDVDSDDVMLLSESGFVDLFERETDDDGTWRRGYKINEAGREWLYPVRLD